jgi:hypothetical protein
MATLKNTTISGTGYFTPPATTVGARPATYTSIIQWTNTGSQAYTVLAGPTPTLTNTSWTAPTGVTSIEVLVVAGGGSGGTGNNSTSSNADAGSGGGAGGLIYNGQYTVTPGNSYTVTVGAGGAAVTATANTAGNPGSNSVFGTLTAIGGGRGVAPNTAGGAGGSGGGGGGGGIIVSGGAGTAGQGYPGGSKFSGGAPYSGQGGGGAGGKGGDYVYNQNNGGGGGNGLNFSISGTSTWYAGGGGGGAGGSAGNYKGGAGGLGGGGKGGDNTATAPGSGSEGTAGTASTGGGGGGGSNSGYTSGAGGSGIVIIKYTVYSNNTGVAGTARYVTNTRTIESVEGANEFKSAEPVRNYAGHNLVTYSEQFDNSVWNKASVTVSVNSTQSPNGTATADTMLETATTAVHGLWMSYGAGTITDYTWSIYVKANGRTWAVINAYCDSSNKLTYFDLTNIVVGTNASGSTATITPVGNGWYRCAVTRSVTSTATLGLEVWATTADNTSTYPGDITKGLYVWGAQLERASFLGPYVRTVDATSPAPINNNGYRIHTYTTTGTSSFSTLMSGIVEVLVVGGGGSGGRGYGGAGGAGGLVYNSAYQVVAGQQYTVVVGAGAAAVPAGQPDQIGNQGSYSQFGTIYALGGGAGGCEQGAINGGSGGSGGGGSYGSKGGPGTNGQGNKGGDGIGGGGHYPCAGGGGAGSAGSSPAAVTVGSYAGSGGNGLAYTISGISTYYAGGGGGGAGYDSGGGYGGLGGLGGGGKGADDGTYGGGTSSTGTAGTANTGGGGGGGNGSNAATGAGGSGIVIVRYRYD